MTHVGAIEIKFIAPMLEQIVTPAMHFCYGPRSIVVKVFSLKFHHCFFPIVFTEDSEKDQFATAISPLAYWQLWR